MKKILEMLDGKKTHIALALGALIYILNHLGYIEPDIYEVLMALDTAFLGSAVRDAIRKLEK